MNKEVLEKVSKCKTVEEVLELAKSNGKNISKDQAKKAFDMAHANGELTDEEVSNVSGGNSCNTRNAYEDVYFDSKEDVKHIFRHFQRVQYYWDPKTNNTYTAVIHDLRKQFDSKIGKWYDTYGIRYKNTWNGKCEVLNARRSEFEK